MTRFLSQQSPVHVVIYTQNVSLMEMTILLGHFTIHMQGSALRSQLAFFRLQV